MVAPTATCPVHLRERSSQHAPGTSRALKEMGECDMIEPGSGAESCVGRIHIRMRVPRSFKQVRQGPATAIVREDLLDRLDQLGLERGSAQSKPTGLRGRSSIGAVPGLLVDGSRVLIRHARRGGLIGRLVPDVFCGRCRSFRELTVADAAHRSGVPTAEVVAAVRRGLFGPFYRAAVYTKELTGTSDLLSYLASVTERRDAAALQRKRDTLREAGRVVRAAHDVGLRHADLQLKNVLVRHNEKPEVFLIDLDKARWLGEPLADRLRIMNLLRLSRSAAKAARSGVCITRADMLRFLIGYTGADGRGRLRRYWRASLLKRMYRAKWALSDALYRAGGRRTRQRQE